MNKSITCVLFIISLLVLPCTVQAIEGEKIRYYRGTQIRYYPNNVIIADVYNRQVIWEIVELSKSLGWNTVYIQNVPRNLRGYTIQYLSDNNIIFNDILVDIEPSCGVCGY